MIKIIVKYKLQILAITIFTGIILGVLLGTWINNNVAEKRMENPYFIHGMLASILYIIGIAIWFLPGIILFWFVYKFITKPCEEKVRKENEIDQRQKYEIFIESLKTIKGNKVNWQKFDDKVFYEFNYENYRVEISKVLDLDFIRVCWDNDATNNFVNARIINFNDEPTAQDVLTHGPWYKEIK